MFKKVKVSISFEVVINTDDKYGDLSAHVAQSYGDSVSRAVKATSMNIGVSASGPIVSVMGKDMKFDAETGDEIEED